jgi:hypothetical protein
LDISQQISRTAGTSGNPGVLTTSSMWYSFEEDVVLDGQDMMAIQGFPDTVSTDSSFSNFDRRHFAGEAFHLPSFGTVVWAWFLNPWGPWWKP